jgi:hypothetical protein
MPKLLDHPALLAHTIYQAVVFDDAIRAGDFDISRVSIYEGVEGMDWEGLTGVLLKEEGLFQQWLAGEKKCTLSSQDESLINAVVDEQLQEIISSQDAWKISDEPVDYQEDSEGRKPTVSSRQIKSLMEQVTGKYSKNEYGNYHLNLCSRPLRPAANARAQTSVPHLHPATDTHGVSLPHFRLPRRV